MIKNIVNSDRQILFKKASEALAEKIRESRTNQPIVIGLCGGRSISGILEVLLEKLSGFTELQRKKLHFFQVDERLVSTESSESNFKLLNEIFFLPAVESNLLEVSQIHPFIWDNEDTEKSLRFYEQKLVRFGGRFNIVILGVGEDGHIAATFPRGVWSEITGKNFIAFDNSPKPPLSRMSASIELLQRSDFGIGIFFGEEKREAYRKFFSNEEDIESCPAKLLYAIPEALIISDVVLR
jgi:6-phosphogluconolactonase